MQEELLLSAASEATTKSTMKKSQNPYRNRTTCDLSYEMKSIKETEQIERANNACYYARGILKKHGKVHQRLFLLMPG